MSKKKGGNNKKGKSSAEDDDWDAILNAELAVKASEEPTPAPPAVPEPASAQAVRTVHLWNTLINVVLFLVLLGLT